MKITAKAAGNSLYIYLDGELDEYNPAPVRQEVERAIDAHASCERVIVNLAGVKFMDSTGIGFLIGRYKKLRRCSTPMFIQSPDTAADKILSMSGVYTLIPKM